MTKLLDRAIKAVRELPQDRQDEAALTLLHFADSAAAPRLTAEQEAEVRASISAREFLTEEEAQELYAKYGP